MVSEIPTPLIVIAGPTASGKTALAMSLATGILARKLAGSEIVSCDSVAIYREFEIGSAKPSLEERAQVPHHMVDVASADDLYTAGRYAEQARVALREIQRRGKLPIVVGGTGLYLRALIDGLSAVPQRSEQLREKLRLRAEAKGGDYLHRLLRHVDKSAAQQIHKNDIPKIIRAIEVRLSAGKKLTELWEQGRNALTGFSLVRIGLNPERTLLYERINTRCQRMFDSGLVEETRKLLDKFSGSMEAPNSPLNAPGYRQAVQVIRGEIGVEEAIAATQQAHRNYAKRQMTWLRRDPAIKWLTGFGDAENVQLQAAELAG
jgi:tRNA dimethylallyltransferase